MWGEGHSNPDTDLRKLQDFQEEAEGPEGHCRGPEGLRGAARLSGQLLAEVVGKMSHCAPPTGLRKLQFLGVQERRHGFVWVARR